MTTSSSTTFLDSKAALWTGRIVSGLTALLLTMDGVSKLLKESHVMEANVRLGYPESVVPSLGIVLVGCAIVYAVPRTSVLGAILLTAWLGGAVASKVRIGEPVLFEIVFGAIVWAGVFLRDARLRSLIPLRKAAQGSELEVHDAPKRAVHA